MINEKKISLHQDAIYEALRFIRKAEVAVKRLKNDKLVVFGCKETAAAKRASMDLTRVLANIRRPR